MIDLNGFKRINEALGFHVGDQLLLKVSTRLKTILSPEDHAVRIDGDKFVLLLKGEQERSAVNQRMDQLLLLLSQSYDTKDASNLNNPNIISINASIGIAFFPIDGSNLNDLLRSAELALSSSEDRSESGYQYFDPSQQAAVEHRRRLEDDLRHALIANQLHLVFQPSVDMTAGKMVGAEALLRWQHPQSGLVPPGLFIPSLEDTGLISPVGEWIVFSACRQHLLWKEMGLGSIPVSINLSARQFKEGNIVDVLRSAPEIVGVPYSAITLGLTESLLFDDADETLGTLNALKEMGYVLSIDDSPF